MKRAAVVLASQQGRLFSPRSLNSYLIEGICGRSGWFRLTDYSYIGHLEKRVSALLIDDDGSQLHCLVGFWSPEGIGSHRDNDDVRRFERQEWVLMVWLSARLAGPPFGVVGLGSGLPGQSDCAHFNLRV